MDFFFLSQDSLWIFHPLQNAKNSLGTSLASLWRQRRRQETEVKAASQFQWWRRSALRLARSVACWCKCLLKQSPTVGAVAILCAVLLCSVVTYPIDWTLLVVRDPPQGHRSGVQTDIPAICPHPRQQRGQRRPFVCDGGHERTTLAVVQRLRACVCVCATVYEGIEIICKLSKKEQAGQRSRATHRGWSCCLRGKWILFEVQVEVRTEGGRFAGKGEC